MGVEYDYVEEMVRRTSKCTLAHRPSTRDERPNITNEGTPGSLPGTGTDRRAKIEQQKIISRST
jgi:hypothetical protein